MHGGKAKNVSARDKMIRGQLKRDEEQDATLQGAGQYPQAKQVDAPNESRVNHVPSQISLARLVDQNQLQFPTTNSISLEQELRNRRLQQQLLLGNRSIQNHLLDVNQQRDRVQMALMLQQRGLQAMRDPNNNIPIGQNHWLNTPANLSTGTGSLGALQYSGLQNHPSLATGFDLSPAGRLLLSQQFGQQHGSDGMNLNNLAVQRILGMNHGLSGTNNINVSDVAATLLRQQQLMDEQRQLTLRSSNLSASDDTVDRQLLEFYLLQQQRNSDSNPGSNT
jgi:hypothetical protein